MKTSRYIYYHRMGERCFIYHLMSESLMEIDDDLTGELVNNNVSAIPSDIVRLLKEKGFVVDDNKNEVESIQYANIVKRYQSKVMRLTILPTINCNFRCWYCYESHKYSRMSAEQADSIFEFIKKEVSQKHLNTLVLDWFGGEPLLCFDNIVYPLTQKVKAWCEENEVLLHQSITTNASLIDEEMVKRIDEIGLTQFQITLDGGKEEHNKVRFSKAMPNSYDVIVKNIHSLCRNVKNVSMTVRINYTPENIDSALTILDSFEEDVRSKICISPHIVWQKAGEKMDIKDKVDSLTSKAAEMGYIVESADSIRRCATCYTDNMEQFVINYDLHVYKCTARDFNDNYSVGVIAADGTFMPNDLFYRYYVTQSSFFCKKCLDCNLLPCCMNANTCLQKTIEGSIPKCEKDCIEQELKNSITNKITAYEKNRNI